MPSIDDIIVKLQADISEVKKALEKDIPAGAQKSGKESGDKFGKTFANGFKAVAGAAVIGQITAAFGRAVTRAAEFEKSFIALNAAARQFGKNQDEVRAQVLKLADDGAIGLETLSQNFRVLLSLGKGVDESFQILDAAKRVGVLNNTVGDANLALQGFVKFLATGEAELADNLDPTLKKVARDLGGYAKVANDAGVQQRFLNAVIEKGAQLQGDYNQFVNSGAGGLEQLSVQTDRLSASIGSILLDAIEPFLTGLINAISGTRDLLESLSGVAQKITVLGVGFTALAAGLTVVFGPVALIFAGVAAAVTGLTVLVDKLIVTNDELVESAKTSVDEHRALEKQILSVAGAADKQIDVNGELAGSLRALGIALTDNTGRLITNAEALERRNQGLKNQLQLDKAQLLQQRAAQQQIIGQGRIQPGTQGSELPQLSTLFQRQLGRARTGEFRIEPRLAKAVDEFNKLEQQVIAINQQIARLESPPETSDPGGFRRMASNAKKAKKEIDELERSTAIIRADLEILAIQRSTEKRLEIAKKAIMREQRLAIDAFNKSEEAKTMGVVAATNKRLEIEKDFEEKLAREKKRITIESEAEKANIVLGNANQIAGGVQQITQGGTSAIRGAGDIAGSVFGPQVGAVFGNIAGIADTVGSIFGKNEEEIQRQLMARIELHKTITQLVKEELEFSQKLAENARQRSRFITEDVQRQLRINRLLIDDEEQRRQADIAVLEPLLSSRTQELGLPQGDPQSVADFIAQSTREQLATQTILGVVSGSVDAFTGDALQATDAGNAIRESHINRIRQALNEPGIPSNVRNAASQALSNLINTDNAIDRVKELVENVDPFNPRLGEIDEQIRIAESSVAAARVAGSGINSLLNQLNIQLDSADDVLSVLEQLQGLQGQISTATLELGRQRELSFVDVSQRGLFSLGTRIGGIAPEQLTLPGGLNQVAVATERQRSFQERQADSLEELVEIQRQALVALQAIAVAGGSALDELNSVAGQGIGGSI